MKKKMYKLLENVMYQGINLEIGSTCDFEALKPEKIADLEKNGVIIDVEKAVEELTGKNIDEVVSEQAQQIIADAKIEASNIIAEAKAEADKIRSEAKPGKK